MPSCENDGGSVRDNLVGWRLPSFAFVGELTRRQRCRTKKEPNPKLTLLMKGFYEEGSFPIVVMFLGGALVVDRRLRLNAFGGKWNATNAAAGVTRHFALIANDKLHVENTADFYGERDGL
jgi:hypothetical protein